MSDELSKLTAEEGAVLAPDEIAECCITEQIIRNSYPYAMRLNPLPFDCVTCGTKWVGKFKYAADLSQIVWWKADELPPFFYRPIDDEAEKILEEMIVELQRRAANT